MVGIGCSHDAAHVGREFVSVTCTGDMAHVDGTRFTRRTYVEG